MSYKLPEPIIDSLLDKLGCDDGFRALFTASPREALSALGFAPALDPSVTQGCWTCLQVDELASKEVISASRDVVRRQLIMQSAGQMPISLQVASAIKRVA